ncbi:hypothetical protein VYU27_003306 [Nannochloropsis oceanica]
MLALEIPSHLDTTFFIQEMGRTTVLKKSATKKPSTAATTSINAAASLLASPAEVAKNMPSTASGTGSNSTKAPADPEKVPITYVKPLHQLQLSEAELREDVNRVLTAMDPQLPSNLVTYSYKERAYKPDPPLQQADLLTIHFAVEGNTLHKDSVEAKQQAQWEGKRKDDMERDRQLALEEAVQAGEEAFFVEDEEKKGMRGGFKYCDRAAQTFNRPTKDKAVGSEPPPVLTFTANCNQWEIYDAYLAQHREQQQQQQDSGSKSSRSGPGGEGTQTVHSEKLGKSLEVLERMLTQNAEDEVFHNFKYWDDTADLSRAQGSLLQLWQFVTERTKRKQVTALAWNPRYHDLFAVGYGSYDFLRQDTGLIFCFTLKNTTTPQYSFSTEAGVMCLDFHPEHPYLLAVGCYDGNVLVFDMRLKANCPIYASTVTTGKHTDPVWKVRWQTLEEGLLAGTCISLADRELCFYSVASDGHVISWLLSKNELRMEPVMQLKLMAGKGVSSLISSSAPTGQSNSGVSSDLSGLDDETPNLLTSLTGLASGSCFDFCPLPGQGHLFLVGTEEGTLHKCSKAYSGQYLATYEGGHMMAVYAVRWNPFHPKLFLSCSADWTVKLWDQTRPGAPLLSFDLGNAVCGVDWSPVSSTTFAAVTSDGRAHVFDLTADKHEPLCVQKVVRRAKLTHVAFNAHEPILLVGDDRGEVTSLKLSPNLRNWHEPKDDVGNVLPHDAVRLQYNNAEKLLATVVGMNKGTGK